jgi:hypothetical protein
MFLQSAQALVAAEQQIAAQGAAIARIEQRLDHAEFIQPSMPNGAESITYARKRLARTFGLPEDVSTFIIRHYSAKPKVGAQVKNPHAEETNAPPTQGYWIKDVNAAARQFIDESAPVTTHFYRHPEFARRFKLGAGEQAA